MTHAPFSWCYESSQQDDERLLLEVAALTESNTAAAATAALASRESAGADSKTRKTKQQRRRPLPTRVQSCDDYLDDDALAEEAFALAGANFSPLSSAPVAAPLQHFDLEEEEEEEEAVVSHVNREKMSSLAGPLSPAPGAGSRALKALLSKKRKAVSTVAAPNSDVPNPSLPSWAKPPLELAITGTIAAESVVHALAANQALQRSLRATIHDIETGLAVGHRHFGRDVRALLARRFIVS